MKITKIFFKRNFPKIAKNSYKNINGKILIIAGAKTMQGAAVLNVFAPAIIKILPLIFL